MGTGSVQRGDVAVLNLDAPNKRAQMKLKIDGTAGEINKSTLTIISIIDKLIRWKTSKDMGDVHKSQYWPNRPTQNSAFRAREAKNP